MCDTPSRLRPKMIYLLWCSQDKGEMKLKLDLKHAKSAELLRCPALKGLWKRSGGLPPKLLAPYREISTGRRVGPRRMLSNVVVLTSDGTRWYAGFSFLGMRRGPIVLGCPTHVALFVCNHDRIEKRERRGCVNVTL